MFYFGIFQDLKQYSSLQNEHLIYLSADFVKNFFIEYKLSLILIGVKQKMKDLIQKTIDLLKKKVKENLELINNNQTRLNEILSRPFSSERTYMIEKNYSANRTLLSENNDLISLQINLVNFLEKHKESLSLWDQENEISELEIASYLDDDELFDLTVQGKLGYGKGHPKFRDDIFFNRLITYYASIEAYEKCNAILTQRRKSKIN